MRETRMVLVDPAGEYIRDSEGHLIGADLSEIPANTNQAHPVMIVIEQKCNMDDWHRTGRTTLPTYDTGIIP